MFVLADLNASLLNPKNFGLEEDLLPNNLIHMPDRRFGLGARLILIAIFDSGSLGHFQAFVRIIELLLLVVLFAVEIWCAFLWIFGGCWLGYLNLGVGIGFERHASSQTRESRGDFRRILPVFRREILIIVFFQFGTIGSKPIS
jgi:hypothetical protein